MNILIKTLKISSIALFILILLCIILIKFYEPIVLDFLTKVNPQIITKMYPDYLASINSIYFEDIVVTDIGISVIVRNYDSNLVVKKVEFKVEKEILYVYVYKGHITGIVELSEKIEYETDMTQIDKVILVGAKNIEKEIWTR